MFVTYPRRRLRRPIPDEIILPPSNKVTGQQKPIYTRVPETLEEIARHLSESPPGQDPPL